MRRAPDHDHRRVAGVGVAEALGGSDQLFRDQALAPLEPPALLGAAQLLAGRLLQILRDLAEAGFHFD